MRLTRFKGHISKVLGFVAMVAMLLAPLPLTNQPASIAWAETPDPPGRVGRLNYMNGPVSFAPGGVNQWATATLNYPLTTGTALWTDQNGRAELHIGSTAIRMDQTTELDILNLDDQTTQLRVAQGTVDISLRQLAADERFEVATPAASVTLVRPGQYRFQADENGVRVTVRTGQVDVATSTYTFSVYRGQTVLVSDTAYQIVATPALDEFGQWSLAREAQEERAAQVAAPYVSPAMTGYEDLGGYGTWRAVGGYGAAWFPTVQVGWAPYRHGRWVWFSPWGWTWVDSAPWGFAPFHYGRWILIGGLWAWIPGPVVVRPVFAPALVVFVVIGDIIGWFPLAPQEVYVPPYYSSPRYHRSININIINITIINVTNVRYVHRHSPHAITLVRGGAFVGADPVQASIISAPRHEVDRAKVVAGAPLQPDVRSLLGRSNGSEGSHRPPVVVDQRQVVVRQAPPVPLRPQVIDGQAPVRIVPVRHAAEPHDARTAPQLPAAPAPNAPQPVAPAPNPGQTRPVAPAPNPVPPQAAQPVAPQPNPVPTPHRVRPGAPAPQPPQPNAPAPQPVAPAPNPVPPQPIAPAPNPGQARPVAPAPNAPQPRPLQPAVPEPNPVPTPHRVRPGAPAPQPNAPAPQPAAPAPNPVPPQPIAPAPNPGQARPVAPAPNAPQPAQPVAPQPVAPQPISVPTPHRVRPVAPAPQPPQSNAPAPQPVAPAPNPVPPQPAQPVAPQPNPVPTPPRVRPVAPAPQPPQPGEPAPQPRPAQPAMPGPQPAPTPRAVQPVVPPQVQPAPMPRPAPTPQVVPAPPQNRPAPQAPRNQIRPAVCDQHSPYYDPRQCPQNRPRGH